MLGLVAQHLILDNPHGYICRLTRSKKCQVPSLSIDFPLVLELMAINLKLKVRKRKKEKGRRQWKKKTQHFLYIMPPLETCPSNHRDPPTTPFGFGLGYLRSVHISHPPSNLHHASTTSRQVQKTIHSRLVLSRLGFMRSVCIIGWFDSICI